MKKFLSVVMVVVLALSLGMAAFAADSVTEVGNGVKVPNSGTVTVDGEEVPVELTTGTVAAEDKLTYTEAAKELKDLGISTAGKNVAVVALFELTADREITAANPLTVTFTVPQGTYVVLHKVNGNWEKVGEGTGTSVTATFTSLSPVAIVKLTDRNVTPTPGLPDYDKPASSLNPGTSSGNNNDTSPNTGVDSTIAFALAAVLMAGAVICATRKEA